MTGIGKSNFITSWIERRPQYIHANCSRREKAPKNSSATETICEYCQTEMLQKGVKMKT